MSQTRKEKLEEKKQFEEVLCKDSLEKTVQEILDNIKKLTKIKKIGPLPKYYPGCGEEISRFRMLAVYKDGLALTYEEREIYYYFLHRNGEDQFYHLTHINI